MLDYLKILIIIFLLSASSIAHASCPSVYLKFRQLKKDGYFPLLNMKRKDVEVYFFIKPNSNAETGSYVIVKFPEGKDCDFLINPKKKIG